MEFINQYTQNAELRNFKGVQSYDPQSSLNQLRKTQMFKFNNMNDFLTKSNVTGDMTSPTSDSNRYSRDRFN